MSTADVTPEVGGGWGVGIGLPDERLGLQVRVLGALLFEPTLYLPIVPEATKGATFFDPRLRPVFLQVRDTDANEIAGKVEKRLQADLSPQSDANLQRLKELLNRFA